MPKQGPVHTYDHLPHSIDLDYIAKDESITDRLVPSGEIHGQKITPNTLPQDKLVDGTLDLGGAKVADYSLADTKIPTGEITFRRLKRKGGVVDALPDTNTEVVHDLDVVPEFVCLVPGDGGVEGYPILV